MHEVPLSVCGCLCRGPWRSDRGFARVSVVGNPMGTFYKDKTLCFNLSHGFSVMRKVVTSTILHNNGNSFGNFETVFGDKIFAFTAFTIIFFSLTDVQKGLWTVFYRCSGFSRQTH